MSIVCCRSGVLTNLAYKATSLIVRQPLLLLDENLQVITANLAFCEMFEVLPTDIRGQPLDRLGTGQWQIPELRTWFERILPDNPQPQDVEIRHTFERIGLKTIEINVRLIDRFINDRLFLIQIRDR